MDSRLRGNDEMKIDDTSTRAVDSHLRGNDKRRRGQSFSPELSAPAAHNALVVL